MATLENAINGNDDAVRIRRLMQHCREEAERAREFTPAIAIPDDASPRRLFDCAAIDVVVQVAINLWRHGDLPLENALILAVSSLVERNRELTKRLMARSESESGFSFKAPPGVLAKLTSSMLEQTAADAPTIVPSEEPKS